MKEKVAILSILANLFLGVGKVVIGILASSASILAEGIHSGMDVISSGISYVGIKIAKKPVDENHPYGHYKFEVLSGLIITIILFLTGAWIVYKSYFSFIKPSHVHLNYLSIGVMLFSVIINEIMARLKIHYGKKENSLSLISDGVHSRVDVYTSLAVLLGLFLNKYWIYTDALLALFIGLYIIYESFKLGKEATSSLLDIYAGKETDQKIKELVEAENIKLTELKTQKKGAIITANLVIDLDGNISVAEANQISKNIKNKLTQEIDNLEYVAIQIDSHNFSSSYYKPRENISKLGLQSKGFGWQNHGIGQKRDYNRYCVCPICSFKVEHVSGIPCSSIICPNCKVHLHRED